MVTSSHDEYLSSFRHLRLRGFILARAGRPWRRTRCRLTSGVLEHGVDAAPWAASGSTADGVVTLAFSGNPEAQLRADGRAVLQNDVCIWPGNARVSLAALRPADWFVLTFTETEWTKQAGPWVDATPGHGATAGGLRPVRPEDLARVRALATRVLETAEDAGPEALSPGAAARLEELLLAEVARLTSGAPSALRRNDSPRIDRPFVLDRVEEALEARPSEPIYLADLCAATGLAERTLRHILVEQYGASPIRVLRNRRLCNLRRSLQAEDDGTEGLARIAARNGFWHMGTLAGDYRKLFGELPSETRRSGQGFVPDSAPAARTVASHGVFGRPADREATMAGAGPAR
jgi:AraC family transcriptional regulator, ethanolamine operon transcriptional activator